jgi:hypothetical protein
MANEAGSSRLCLLFYVPNGEVNQNGWGRVGKIPEYTYLYVTKLIDR